MVESPAAVSGLPPGWTSPRWTATSRTGPKCALAYGGCSRERVAAAAAEQSPSRRTCRTSVHGPGWTGAAEAVPVSPAAVPGPVPRRGPGGHGSGTPGDTPALLQLLVKKGISVRTEEGQVSEKELSHAPVKLINQALRESTEDEEQPTRPPNCTDVQPAQDPNQSSRWYWKLVPHAIAFCLKESGNKPPVIRYRKDKVQSKLTPTFPLVSGLKDLSNGCAVGATLHFYCPGLLPLEDVCLKDTMSVADSVYNLQLIREFCETHLQRCCPLQVEDLLYAPPVLHTNILVFLSELLDCFEVKKPDFVKPVQPIDLTSVSGVLDCTSPVSCHTNSSPSYIFKQPFVPIPSEVSAENQSWAKKQISGPLSAVAFSIPFGLDSDVDIVMGNPIDCVFRPVSSDGLAPAVPAMTSPVSAYSPPEDLSHLMSSSAPAPRSWGSYMAPLGELPTIEEALQVTHPRKTRASPDCGLREPPPVGGRDRKDRGRSSDMSRDDDSVLRDGSVDSSEASDDTPRNTPGNIRPNWGRQSVHSPNGSPRMTSFAERRDSRKRQPAAPGEEASSAPTTPGSPAVGPGRQEGSGTPGPEAVALGARLEEKRKSIEAQKRRIEAIFAKHKQRLGKTAFLQLQREQAEGEGDAGGDAALSLDERLTQVEEQLQRDEEQEQKEKASAAPPRLEKQVTFSLDNKDRAGGSSSSGPGPGPSPGPGPTPGVQEYTEVVQKLSEALECLQRDMKKLTQQQQQLISGQCLQDPPRTPTKTPSRTVSKAWLIPAGSSTSHRSSSSPKTALSSSCPAPRSRTTTTPRSPKTHSRPHAPHTRPSELKFPTLTRVLTPPQSVDSLPHLRRVSPSKCQVQTSSSFRIGGPQPHRNPLRQSSRNSLKRARQTQGPARPPPSSAWSWTRRRGAPRRTFSSRQQKAVPQRGSDRGQVQPDGLSVLSGAAEGGSDEHTDETHEFSSDSMSDHTDAAGPGSKSLGPRRVSPEGAHREEDMAQRRATLLERQQRRSEELRRRRQWHEQDLENRLVGPEQRAVSPSGSPAGRTSSSPTPPATPGRRGDFTRAEYARRQQLRIMDDLDKMLKQKPNPTGRAPGKKTRARPRSMTREGTQLSLSPAKSPSGPRLTKVYSHSSLNLPASGDSGNSSSEAKKPQSRPSSPCRPGKDSDPGSSSSAQDYTGPKLFKEPSFKSNKFIIHNALSRCCLAGKVNETQKNKIVEEMEKSAANHFLILFRDSSCQFRGVYTLSPDAQELVRLTGVGPRAVRCAQVESIYKYSSDRKQFCPIPSKTLGMTVDAFTIPGPLWQGGGAGGGANRRASITKKSSK
ncbi:hypothetical protein WMY93_005794 [Mugilogobius chulae]|uniref:CKK domain-containing protein n=1 Tax=Mugilogobius chulae TaxID=88201 RepID=A0AAW0PKW5_9GOBI